LMTRTPTCSQRALASPCSWLWNCPWLKVVLLDHSAAWKPSVSTAI
jgi:hypothetical protein